MKKTFRMLALLLALSLLCTLPAFAAKTFAKGSAPLESKFDLRDYGFVSPVDVQYPWTLNWAFSATAAAETAILAELGKTYTEYPIDFSEWQLAWFNLHPTGSENPYGQAGEGLRRTDGTEALELGDCNLQGALFLNGTGPVPESFIPYYGIDGAKEISYEKDADWSVRENNRYAITAELKNENILPDPATFTLGTNREYKYQHNEKATYAIKQELKNGRAVSVRYYEQYGLTSANTKYSPYTNAMTYAHYTYAKKDANHTATIVGWDDTYSRFNFLDQAYQETSGQFAKVLQPPADGAWIVKETWDSQNSNENGLWGVDSSGYCYVSYYDQSLSDPVSYEFYPCVEQEPCAMYGYDFTPCASTRFTANPGDKAANVFRNDNACPVSLQAFSVETGANNITTHYSVYSLYENAVTPEDGMLVAEGDITYTYRGFHRIELPQPAEIPAGGKFSVVISQTDENEYPCISLKAPLTREAALAQGAPYYCTTVVNPGESVYYNGIVWSDWTDQRLIRGTENTGISFDNIPIKVYYTAENDGLRLTDVAETAYYRDAAYWAYGEKLFPRYGQTRTFAPGTVSTREELVYALWKLAGSPIASNAVQTFDDVDPYNDYAPAIAWAVSAGVTKGTGNNCFSPKTPCTRGQIMTMIARFAGVPEGEAETGFTDVKPTGYYAFAIKWAVDNGITTGTSETTFSPDRTCLREELATFLFRGYGPVLTLHAQTEGSASEQTPAPEEAPAEEPQTPAEPAPETPAEAQTPATEATIPEGTPQA